MSLKVIDVIDISISKFFYKVDLIPGDPCFSSENRKYFLRVYQVCCKWFSAINVRKTFRLSIRLLLIQIYSDTWQRRNRVSVNYLLDLKPMIYHSSNLTLKVRNFLVPYFKFLTSTILYVNQIMVKTTLHITLTVKFITRVSLNSYTLFGLIF